MENAFSKNLKRIRTNKGMNQSDLASKINVKQATISSWESGRTEPSMGDIYKISEVLECSQEELIGIKKNVGNITVEDILVKINSLNLDELQKIEDVIKNQIHIRIELDNLEKQRAEQEARLKEYADKIEILKRQLT